MADKQSILFMAFEANLDGVKSSYLENKYGDIFYSLIQVTQPACVVELGTYLGYSALHIAAALRQQTQSHCQLWMVDLWEDYQFRHCSLTRTRDSFTNNGLIDLPHCDIHFLQEDALKVAEQFDDGQVDFLHIDLSNDGVSLQRTLDVWHKKLRPGGMLLLEGGSPQRDQIPWMLEFKKTPISTFLHSAWFQSHYSHTVIAPFPSLTIATKQ